MLGDFADSLEPKFRQALEGKKPINFEVSGRLPSRTETGHWIVHYLPIRDGNHNVARVGAVVLDITAQKELEHSLQTIGGQLLLETGRLRVLSDVSKLLSSNWDVPQVFPKISARIRRVLRQEFASFALHDEGSGLLVNQATDFPLSKGLMPRVQLSSSHTPPGQAMQRREAMIFTKDELQGINDEFAKGMVAEGLQSRRGFFGCFPPHGVSSQLWSQKSGNQQNAESGVVPVLQVKQNQALVPSAATHGVNPLSPLRLWRCRSLAECSRPARGSSAIHCEAAAVPSTLEIPFPVQSSLPTPEPSFSAHPDEVDPLYLLACRLEWDAEEDPSAGWELLAAAQSSRSETRAHARALLSSSRSLSGIGSWGESNRLP